MTLCTCVLLCFDDTFFETSDANHPRTHRHIPHHWATLSYSMNLILSSIFEHHTADSMDVIPVGIQLPVEGSVVHRRLISVTSILCLLVSLPTI